jgi:hypothetical protein
MLAFMALVVFYALFARGIGKWSNGFDPDFLVYGQTTGGGGGGSFQSATIGTNMGVNVTVQHGSGGAVNFKSEGDFVNGNVSISDANTDVSGFVSANRSEGTGNKPAATTTTTFLSYSKCETLGSIRRCDSGSGVIRNDDFVGVVGKGVGTTASLTLNVDPGSEPGINTCTMDFNVNTGELLSSTCPGLPQGQIHVVFTKTGNFWSRSEGHNQSHVDNIFIFNSTGTTTSFSAKMAGNLLGILLGP